MSVAVERPLSLFVSVIVIEYAIALTTFVYHLLKTSMQQLHHAAWLDHVKGT